MNGGILIDWYVASQLGLQPKEMRAFLSAMDALRCPDTGNTISKLNTLDGLSYMERWVHVYVFPDVCKELRRHGIALPIAEAIRYRIVDQTLETTSGDLRRSLVNALNSFIAKDSPLGVLRLLAKAAEHIGKNEIIFDRSASTTADYFDIEDQYLVALVLSLILELAFEDSQAVGITFGKGSDQSKDASPLAVLHKRAMQGDHGRWCHLLAIDICLSVPELFSHSELVDSLHSVSPKCLLTSPDLIWREIRMRFEISSKADDEVKLRVLDRLFEELLTFRHWQSLALPLLDEDGKLEKLTWRQKVEVRKSLIFWQEAIWHSMAGIKPNEAALRLQRIWLPRMVNTRALNKSVVRLPYEQREIGQASSLQRLLGEQFNSLRDSPSLVYGQIDDESAYWWSHSPWPSVVPPQIRRQEVVHNLACAAAASFGARLLLQAQPADGALLPWQIFAAHLLYCFQEFRSYQYLDKTEKKPEKEVRDIDVLVHTCRAVVEKIAGGRMQYPEPAYFVTVLEDTIINGFQRYPALAHATLDLELEKIIKRQLLASGLRLVEYAMTAADDSGRSRWLNLVHRFIRMPNAQDLDEDDRLLRKLLIRFLQPPSELVLSEDGLQRINDLVTEYLTTGKKPQGLKHRELLLVPTKNFEIWKWPDLLEEIPFIEENSALILTWACQRVAASMYDRSTPPALRERWSAFMRQCLDRLTSPTPFDRFLRVRFIELLCSDLLCTDRELALAMARRLIEFGTPRDLQLLVKWNFEKQIVSEEESDIRRYFFYGLLQYRRTRIRRSTNFDLVKFDPDTRIDSVKRLALIDRLVACCLVPNQLGQTHLADYLRELARRDRAELFQLGPQSDIEQERLHMDQTGKFQIDSNIDGRFGRALAMAVNPNTEQLLLVDPLKGSMHVNDLFSEKAVEPDGSSCFLGVIEKFDGPDNDDALIYVDSKEKHRLRVGRTILPKNVKIGEMVAVQCGPARYGDAWQGTADCKIYELPQKTSVHKADVGSLETASGSLPVLIKGLQKPLDWKMKTQNFLALFSPSPIEKNYKIWVTDSYRGTHDNNRRHRCHIPVVLDFVDLLIDNPLMTDGKQSIILCLDDIERSASGEVEGIIVEVLPLQRYRLRLATDLAQTASEKLLEKIEDIRTEGLEAPGLFLTVRIVTGEGGPLIDLVDEKSSLSMNPEYPIVLSLPFDDRNIRWRGLFTEKAEDAEDRDDSRVLLRGHTKSEDRGTVLADLPEDMRVLGFPDQIKVKIVSPNRLTFGEVDRFVEIWVESETWSPHTASVEGMFVEVNALTLSRNRNDTIRELLNLKEGTCVELRQFSRKIDMNGFVLAYTAENFPIWVEAESLSMLPIDEGDVRQSAGVIPRIARLHGNKQWRRHKINPAIHLDQLPSWVKKSDRAEGILITIPRPSEYCEGIGCTCGVGWRSDNEIEYQQLQVMNLAAFRTPIWQGSRIIVELVGGKNRVSLEIPNFRAEALWEEAEDIDDKLYIRNKNNFIGSAYLQGELRNIFQIQGGSFCALKGDNHAFMPELLDHNIKDISRADWWGPKFRGEATQRCVLRLDKSNKKLCGLRKQGDSPGEVRLVNVDLSITNHKDEHGITKLFVLRRRLTLQSRRKYVVLKPENESVIALSDQDFNALRVTMLNDWLRRKTILEGEYHSATGIFRFQDRSFVRLFPNGIEVKAEMVSWSRRPAPYRSIEARSVVIGDNSTILSCRDVSPLTLEEFEQNMGCMRGELVRMEQNDIELFLVGVRKVPDSKDSPSQFEYLFEWGYGYWMVIQSCRLRYRGKSIEMGNLSLFVEDRISAVEFEYDQAQNELILNIVDSVPSQAHILFNQAHVHKIVHPLHVIVSQKGNPKITQVDGFDPISHNDPCRKVVQGGGVISGYDLQLDNNGQNVILKRARGKNKDEYWEGVIFGRLNTRTFLDSYGTTLLFDYVRLGREHSSDSGALKNGDCIFAITGKIVEHGSNDLAVLIQPYDGLDAEDISDDIRQLRIPRREFSYRQQTLTRLYRQDPFAVDGQHVIIKIYIDRYVHASLKKGLPLRHSVVLDTMLAVAGSYVFAIYAGLTDETDEKQHIRIEFRPGVLVGIPRSDAHISDELLVGDVVRISVLPSKSSERYIIRRAMYSDIRYALERRPVVALPKQNLGRIGNLPPYSGTEARINALDSFTIGDLPDIIGNLRYLVPGNQMAFPTDQQLSRFMAMEHPKLAWLQKVEQHPKKEPTASITPDFTQTIRAGRLIISRQVRNGDGENVVPDTVGEAPVSKVISNEIRFESLPNADSQIRNLRTDWYLLTFRDQSSSEVAKACIEASWFYHDRQTITWCPDPETPIRRVNIPPSSIQSGPLFIEVDGRRAMLRYAQKDIPRHAIGLSNLIDVLLSSGSEQKHKCVVAGVPEEGGLYVEVVPGRIVEIPPSMAVWGSDIYDTVSLETLDWKMLAQGDELTAQIIPQFDSYAPERLVLDWTQSIRNAFGPVGAALRRQCFDCEAGEVVYGAGEFKLRLPSTTPKKMPEMALVGGSNTLSSLAKDKKPPLLATVLLVRRNDGSIGVDGFDALRVSPERSWAWEADSLMNSLITKNDRGVWIDWVKLGHRIDLAGGAFPVTVENVVIYPESKTGVLYFSRRHQELNLSIEKVALGRVIGQLPESGWIFIQVGGRQSAIPEHELVRGLPKQFLADAIGELRRKAILVWVKRTDKGYEFGFSNTYPRELLVRPQLILAKSEEEVKGMICVDIQDRCLHWLPVYKAAAAPLTKTLAESAFLRNLRSIKVAILDDRCVSIIDHPRVMQELKSLHVGERLGVEIISNENADHPLWEDVSVDRKQLKFRLVRSRASGLIMSAVIAGSQKGFMVEVLERRSQDKNTFLLLVLVGKRRMRIDFPHWMVDSSQSGEQNTLMDGVFSVEDDPRLPIKSKDIVSVFYKVCQGERPSINLEELRQYCGAYRKAKTTSLLAGISAAVLLAKIADQKDNEVLMLIRNIGFRALRSFHLELLIRHWRERRDGILNEESRAVNIRIDKLLSAISNQNEKIQETMMAIDDLYDYLALNGGSDYNRAITTALAVGLGKSKDIDKLLLSYNRYFEHLEETARLVRLLMMHSHPSEEYIKTVISQLQLIAQKLIKSGFDIPLNPVIDSRANLL